MLVEMARQGELSVNRFQQCITNSGFGRKTQADREREREAYLEMAMKLTEESEETAQ